MQETKPERPLPHPSALSQPYWDGTAQGKLLIQTCGDCGKLRHYPRWICDACHSFDVTWTEATGRGRVHSWMISQHAYHAAFADEIPYTLVIVDLEEGVRSLGRFSVPSGAGLRIGLPVHMRMEPVEGGFSMPLFIPQEETG